MPLSVTDLGTELMANCRLILTKCRIKQGGKMLTVCFTLSTYIDIWGGQKFAASEIDDVYWFVFDFGLISETVKLGISSLPGMGKIW